MRHPSHGDLGAAAGAPRQVTAQGASAEFDARALVRFLIGAAPRHHPTPFRNPPPPLRSESRSTPRRTEWQDRILGPTDFLPTYPDGDRRHDAAILRRPWHAALLLSVPLTLCFSLTHAFTVTRTHTLSLSSLCAISNSFAPALSLSTSSLPLFLSSVLSL